MVITGRFSRSRCPEETSEGNSDSTDICVKSPEGKMMKEVEKYSSWHRLCKIIRVKLIEHDSFLVMPSSYYHCQIQPQLCSDRVGQEHL